MEYSLIKTYSERLTWIDIFKGIGIVLVVFGHSGIPTKLSWWIWSFHMPMFFFISGFLFNPATNPSFKIFFFKRVKMLVFPYFSYSIIIMFCFFLLSNINNYTKFEVFTLSGFINVFLYGWNGLALWFIPVLFFLEIIFYCIRKISNRNRTLSVLIVFFSLVTFLLSKHQIRLLYKFEVVPGALVFYGLGCLLHSHIVNFIKTNKIILFVLVAITLFIINFIFCFINNSKLDMCYNTMGNFFYTYISALSGIFCMLISSFLLSKQLGMKNPIVAALNFLGKNTLIILLLHQLIKICLNILIPFLSLNGNTSTIMKHLLFWIIMVIIIKFINKYLYFTIGRTVPL
jgi:fucose 4-O-acetylase-like acetyltransferase